MTCLQTVNLNHTSIGNEEIFVLAPVLAALPHLHTFDVSISDLGSKAMSALLPVFAREGSPLSKLGIGEKRFTFWSVCASAKGLCAATQLQELSFVSIQLGKEGWAALAPALSCLAPSLHSLELGWDW